jgi:hypothetical protein
MGNSTKKIKLDVQIDLLSSRPTRTNSKTLLEHVPEKPTTQTATNKQNYATGKQGNKGENGRALPREPLGNGQGKSVTFVDSDHGYGTKPKTNNTKSNSDMDISSTESTNNTLLHPPIINTMGKIATEATTPQLRKQNKLHRNETLITQPIASQWHCHEGLTIIGDDHWERQTNTFAKREMAPQGRALLHEAGSILKDWERFGAQQRQEKTGQRHKYRRQSTAGRTNPRSNLTCSNTSQQKWPTKWQMDKHASSSGTKSGTTTRGN